jgi:2-polyprenyl-3-methyl-5-hydroxy-6-metoxy-1,4-benzoquinol methylase
MASSLHDRTEAVSKALEHLEAQLVGTLLSPKAATQFAQGAIAAAELTPVAERIKALSHAYVSEHSGQLPAVTDREAAKAYALYFLPINFAKVLYLLDELPADFKTRPLEVLDFGCGPGTASLAVQSWHRGAVSLTLVDHASAMLDVARSILAPQGAAARFLGVEQFRDDTKRYDLIVLANVLTELASEQCATLLDELLQKLTPNGVVLILEPALQGITRRMQALRDTALDRHQELTPLFPCTRRDPCPMLVADTQSWCHGTLRWQAPRLVMQLDALTGFNKHRVKFCAFIFQRDGLLRQGLRILEPAQRKKFGVELSVCGADCYGRKVVAKRGVTMELLTQLRRADQFEVLPLTKEIFERA